MAHEGEDPRGEFCQTLTLTCVATGWTEVRALPNKAQRWCFEALVDVEGALPFPLLGLDSDNGSEFINHQLVRYCIERGITFTRTRPYRKNDNCYVEQKNWPVVRQQVGYARYDSPQALEALRQLYRVLRLYVNYFQPQMKLVSKTRHGATVTKRFDRARTPYQRALASPWVSEEVKDRLRTIYPGLNPAQLKRELAAWQSRLLRLATDPTRKEVRIPGAPLRGALSKGHSRTLLVMQPELASRTS